MYAAESNTALKSAERNSPNLQRMPTAQKTIQSATEVPVQLHRGIVYTDDEKVETFVTRLQIDFEDVVEDCAEKFSNGDAWLEAGGGFKPTNPDVVRHLIQNSKQ